MLYLLYDGSFDGFLTTIYVAFYQKEEVGGIESIEKYEKNLFNNEKIIETDTIKARKVYEAIKLKISSRALKNVYYAYLSEVKSIGLIIYQYLKLGFKVGKVVDNMITDNRVLKIHQTVKKVGIENQRLKGLLRFQRLQNDIYLGQIEPDHNILPLIAPYFAQRLSDQNWIIHDLKRNKAVIYNKREWCIISLSQINDLHFSMDEDLYQNLWKVFFRSISIGERANPELQCQHMPRRYHKYLIEIDNK